ncbi:slit homolog 3 protein-like [Zerene cesonia]|uniref:slit homolog 3 protein-like n=1 Tax=Zerene cesonia TaxID=33412 RepID=UPI0018E552FB|nr:slit homolog 3 protein-like [Zerene cesonia]XP_038219507.1 slit homolog 3 protein-like [Zerene cesonia]XP_038219508.1 slit homolog 3 protein-like [Zerene cesonia]
MAVSLYTFSVLSILFYYIEATPICINSVLEINKLVCSPGNYSELILTRGIVSDNNKTTSIILSACRISDVDFEAFNRLPALRHLDLSKNTITTLKLGVLDGFRALTHLNLSYNYLKTFPLGLFDQKPNLINLDVSSNRIDTLVLGVFDPLRKLEHLDLSSNSLVGDNVDPYLFDRSRKIKYLSFSRNNMNNANADLLHAVSELQTLKLEECELEEIPEFIIVRSFKVLKNLHLSGNLLKEVKNSHFSNMSTLLTLDLSGNHIENVEENSFKSLNNLRSIDLRNNLLKVIPETLFQNIPALSNIDMSHNLIEYVPVNAFRGTKVRNLNLSNNQFTYLQDNFCLELRNSGAILTKFYFNDNPWQCSCLRDIINEVKKYEIIYNTAKYDGKHPVCVVSDKNNCQRHFEYSKEFLNLHVSEINN